MFFSQDFGEFMKENRLAPVPAQTILESAELPIERGKTRFILAK